MKRLLLIIFLFKFAVCEAQVTLPTKEGKVVYEFVDTLGANKETLYSRSKIWFANAFKNARFVIQNDDREAGIVIGKGSFVINQGIGLGLTMAYNYDFTVDVTVKENKYRVRLHSFILGVEEPATTPIEKGYARYLEGKNKKSFEKQYTALNEKVLGILEDVKQAMIKSDTDF